MRPAEGNEKVRKHPVAVTVVAAITLGAGLLVVAFVLAALGPGGLWEEVRNAPLFGDRPTILSLGLTETGDQFFRAVIQLTFGVVTIALSIGLFNVRRWAWVGLMAWTGLNLALNLVRYWYKQPDYLAMLFDVIVIFTLNLAEVQEAFGIRRRTDDGLASSD